MADRLDIGSIDSFEWYEVFGLLLLFLMALSEPRMTLTVLILISNFDLSKHIVRLVPFAIGCLMGSLAHALFDGIGFVLIDVMDCFTLFYAIDKWHGSNTPGTAGIIKDLLVRVGGYVLWRCDEYVTAFVGCA